ncbi:uncharacterized protein LOC113274493 [Papaver somniferum]|uniref:uncharacterized protein LOC113274493 n=1 Tax=Papaver somniferum TaxID=3469 RepID=UPI000E701F88|nr:uncharacterized protein LOC113274493 [Papaver somniferum]
MEYLSRSLLVAETNKFITGIKVSRKAPPMTHLLFADDILIFGQANINNLSPNDCAILAQALNMSLVSDSEYYFGSPLLLGHSKIKSFDPIMQSFEARLSNYIGTTINQAGRSTLIKSVLNSLLTYQMGCIKIPTTLISKLDSLQRNFWWAHRIGKGIKFIAWDDINIPKDLRGLGFRNLENFNIALICKLVWKILTEQDELWVQILNTKDWNVHLVYYLFSPESAESILAMTIPAIGTILFGYQIGKNNSQCTSCSAQVWKALWKVKLPHKVKLFAWKCIRDIVPTRDKLSKYKPNIELHCSLCNHPNESVNYMLLECPYARSVWLSLNTNVGNIMFQHGSLKNWVISWFSAGNNLIFGSGITRKEINELLMVAVWTIWKDRCSKVFQNINPNNMLSLENIHGLTALVNNNITVSNNSLQVLRWKPPDSGYIKINLDASFLQENIQCGIGLIIRNFAGKSIGAQGKYFDGGMMQD